MRKIFYVIATVTLLIFFAWLLLFLFGKISHQLSKNDANTTSQTADEAAADAEFADDPGLRRPDLSFDEVSRGIKSEYKEDLEFQQCADEVVQSCLTATINKKITQTGDIGLCDDFLTDQARESCRNTQSMQLARERKDVSFCDDLPDGSKNNCLAEVATAKAVEAQSLAECDALSDEDKVSCVNLAAERLANQTLDSSWCDLGAENTREICKDEVRFQIQDREDQVQLEEDFAAQEALLREEGDILVESVELEAVPEEVDSVEVTPAPVESPSEGDIPSETSEALETPDNPVL